jgi:hypothetical protein
MVITRPARALFGGIDQLLELGEKVLRIIRPRSSFRVVLHAENRVIPVTDPLDCSVIEIDVCHFNIGREG